MEGGVKRGLTGSVLVPAENTVTIVAKGPRKRLDSFADWLETTSQLVSKVSIGEACAPEDVELTSKFESATPSYGFTGRNNRSRNKETNATNGSLSRCKSFRRRQLPNVVKAVGQLARLPRPSLRSLNQGAEIRMDRAFCAQLPSQRM